VGFLWVVMTGDFGRGVHVRREVSKVGGHDQLKAWNYRWRKLGLRAENAEIFGLTIFSGV
jgi:hypothetical protein